MEKALKGKAQNGTLENHTGKEQWGILPRILRRVLIGWLSAALIELCLIHGKVQELFGTEAFKLMSFGRVVAITCGVFGTLMILARFCYGNRGEKWEKWTMAVIFFLLSSVAVGASFRGAFLGACVMCLLILLVYCRKGWNGTETPKLAVWKRNRGAVFTVIGLSVLFFLLVSVWTVARVYSFRAPTYDFGIFSQMFYSMKETGLPMTTLERDGTLSHFAVHVSPIYYLLLPFYALSPYPATLQILQGVVITSAVIPLWKLGKEYGLGDWQRVLLCGMLFLYPAFVGGVGYDIHENCFLTPLLLWVFYGIEKGKKGLIFGAAILTLTVKEDAAVYVAVLALWLIVRASLQSGKKDRKSLIVGLCLMAVSVLWFFGVTAYLKYSGDGVMSGRYRNLMDQKGDSLFSVLCNACMHPMKVLYECTDPEKLYYIALTLIPLLGLPLITRRYERYILLIPYILVNLLSDYTYQHEIFFQYSFGTTAFLFYLSLVNLGDLKTGWVKTAVLSCMVILCGVCFSLVVVPKAMTYPKIWFAEKETFAKVRETLAQIPTDRSVTAGTFYTAELSQRETVYDLGYASREHLLESEYIVLDPRQKYSFKQYETTEKFRDLEAFIGFLIQEGYEEVARVDNCLLIFRKTLLQ